MLPPLKEAFKLEERARPSKIGAACDLIRRVNAQRLWTRTLQLFELQIS